MSCSWHNSNDGLDNARRLVEALPDPDRARRYLSLPHSYVCERLAEADATEAVNLREIQALRRQKDAIGTALTRERIRIEELERELEKPALRLSVPEWAQIAALAVAGASGIYLLVQGWARLCVWIAR